MATISPIFTQEKFSSETESVLEEIKTTMNAPFTPNFFRVWGNAPESLAGIWQVMKNVLMSGKLPRKLKETILVAVSTYGESNYCVSAHSAILKMLGVTNEEIAEIKQSLSSPSSPQEKAALDFTVRIAKDSNCLQDKDYEELKGHGYSEEEIMELIAMSGMAVFYGLLANATKINVDEGFEQVLSQ
ncbi:MAG: carboxymuconolactone decarboxylase family protein [Bacteroidota bacterium]